MPGLIAARLAQRLRDSAGSPLITYYDIDSGERTELSAVTFANWVAKTVNLIDEYGLTGEPIALPLARHAPGHWITAIWEVACWTAGATVDLTEESSAELVVSGPDWRPYAHARELLVCSLHPFAIGLPGLGAGTDFDLTVRVQPDRHAVPPPGPEALAWRDADRALTQADLVGAAAGLAPSRRLVVPGDPWETARDGIVAALCSGGSTVVVAGTASAEQVDRIVERERVAEREHRDDFHGVVE